MHFFMWNTMEPKAMFSFTIKNLKATKFDLGVGIVYKLFLWGLIFP